MSVSLNGGAGGGVVGRWVGFLTSTPLKLKTGQKEINMIVFSGRRVVREQERKRT